MTDLLVPTVEQVRAEMARRSLRVFVREAWPRVEPQKMRWNWHLDAICDHLEAACNREIRRLIITVAPRRMKSLATSVFMPAWRWVDHPEERFLLASYAESLSLRDANKTRRLMQSAWYRRNFGDSFDFRADQNAKGRYDNDMGGFRVSSSVGGGATGEGGDILILDDPIKIEEADSEAVRAETLGWVDETWLTRENDPDTSVYIVIQQRTHHQDVAGHLIEKGGWTVLCLPEEYEPGHPQVWIDDPRTEKGELLWPERFSAEYIAQRKVDLGSMKYAALFQQRPTPEEGGIFKRGWWQTWEPQENAQDCANCEAAGFVEYGEYGLVRCAQCNGFGKVGFYPKVDTMLQSWDMAFKDTVGSDFVCGGVWGRQGARYYLLDLVNERMDFPATVEAVKQMTRAWPGATLKLVEDKANGPAVISMLKKEITGLVAVNPKGGKVARANAVSPLVEAGNVFLPPQNIAPWRDEYVQQHTEFDKGAHDDMVDMTTQALARFGPVGVGYGPEVWT